jgi:hypothetical protein
MYKDKKLFILVNLISTFRNVTLPITQSFLVFNDVLFFNNYIYDIICIKLYLIKKIKYLKVFKMLQTAFGQLNMQEQTIYKWFKKIQEDRELVQDVLMGRLRKRVSMIHKNIKKIKK